MASLKDRLIEVLLSRKLVTKAALKNILQKLK